MSARAGRRRCPVRDLDAYLFDAGGVLVLPGPDRAGAAARAVRRIDGDRRSRPRPLPRDGGRRARSAASRRSGTTTTTSTCAASGCPTRTSCMPPTCSAGRATRGCGAGRSLSSVATLRRLHEAGVPIGVVSNASGQIADVLRRSGVCQVGDGDHTPVRVIVDSHVVGVSKPQPGDLRPRPAPVRRHRPGADRLRRRLGDDGRRRRPGGRSAPDPARPVRRPPRRRLRPGPLPGGAAQPRDRHGGVAGSSVQVRLVPERPD